MIFLFTLHAAPRVVRLVQALLNRPAVSEVCGQPSKPQTPSVCALQKAQEAFCFSSLAISPSEGCYRTREKTRCGKGV